MSNLITTERMEAAILYLCRTDEALAKARARYNGLKEQCSTIKALAYQRSLSTVAAQKAQDAAASEQYRHHLATLEQAEYDYLLLATRRQTELAIIDCWRSLNAAKNKGML